GHSDARGLQSSNLVCCGASTAGDDGAGMTHAAPGRSRPAANKTCYWLSYVCFDEVSRIFLGAPADFPDENDSQCLGIVIHETEGIDKGRANNGVASNADAGGLTDAQAGELVDRFVGQCAAARDHANMSRLVDASWHNSNLAFAR